MMAVRDVLQSPSVKTWLGGLEPAWTMLDQSSFDALRHSPPSMAAGPLWLATNLSADELRRSAFASGTATLLRASAQGEGLKLTATGNLSRTVVAEMIESFAWPGFDKAEAFRFHKVVNEPDFLPLHFERCGGAGQRREGFRFPPLLRRGLTGSPRSQARQVSDFGW
jgi:hypothetical protein